MAIKHFLSLEDLGSDELRSIIQRAIELKKKHKSGEIYEPLKNKTLGMIFDKSSTRTRVSAEVAMTQLGGSSVFLSPRDSQLGRGEPLEDTAKVLSRMVDAVFIRTHDHADIKRFSENSIVPVINALTDQFHPCQLLADIQTYEEHRGDIRKAIVVWVGDGNNMCHSYINASKKFGFNLRVCTPVDYRPDQSLLSDAPDVEYFDAPEQAMLGANLVVTDVWASMGQEDEQKKRERDFYGFQINSQLMNRTNNALFMHCLPAHRGEEVEANVIDAEGSVVWDEAENRLHSLKALLEFILCPR